MTVERVSAAAADAKLRGGGDFVLLDCREDDELRIASIKGALHIPMGDIPSRLPSLDPDKDYVVFCHHGKRSDSVAAFLKQQGFEKVASLRGGIDAWSVEIDPNVARY